MDAENPRDLILEVINEIVPKKISPFLEASEGSEPDFDGLLHWINTTFPLGLTKEKAALETRSVEGNAEYLTGIIRDAYERKASLENPDALRGLERYIMSQCHRSSLARAPLRDGWSPRGRLPPGLRPRRSTVDTRTTPMPCSSISWTPSKARSSGILRSTTNLQAFEQMLANIPQILSRPDLALNPETATDGQSQPTTPDQPPAPKFELPLKRELPKACRNDPCPCGSGKKFKSCCGRLA
jgi:preprotein translocase subunit SecA